MLAAVWHLITKAFACQRTSKQMRATFSASAGLMARQSGSFAITPKAKQQNVVDVTNKATHFVVSNNCRDSTARWMRHKVRLGTLFNFEHAAIGRRACLVCAVTCLSCVECHQRSVGLPNTHRLKAGSLLSATADCDSYVVMKTLAAPRAAPPFFSPMACTASRRHRIVHSQEREKASELTCPTDSWRTIEASHQVVSRQRFFHS